MSSAAPGFTERRRDLSRAVRWRALTGLDPFFARGLPRSESRVLLDCANGLMAGYVLRAFATVASDPGIRGHITSFPGRTERHLERAAELGLAWVSGWRALRTRWDLVLLSDHAPLKYAPSIPQLILPHGPGPSRLVRDGSYYYDRRRALWPDGTRVYDLMLDTSEHAAERALEWLPEYQGRVRVAGDLVADELLKHDQLQGGSAVTKIAVMSTWGPHGLVPVHGEWLFPEMVDLAARGTHEFVFTMHQNLWDVRRAGTDRWVRAVDGLRVPGIRVVGPDEEWTQLLPGTDAAIADHTSLGALYSILGRPIIPVALPRELLTERTFSAWLYDNRRPVGDAAALRQALSDLAVYGLDGAPVVVDHLGESAALTADAIREVLHRPGRGR